MAKAKGRDEKDIHDIMNKCFTLLENFKVNDDISIVEHRVVLPITVEEYQVAQLWSVAEASKNETGGGEGIEVLKNEPFIYDEASPREQKLLLDNDGNPLKTGQFTHKIYHLQSRVPAFVRMVAPKGSLEIHEIAWNAYPFCRTVILNPDYMKDSFLIKIETLHKGDDRGQTDNVHNLSPKDKTKREVRIIDIAAPLTRESDYKKEWDPTKNVFLQRDDLVRGPLTHNKGLWMQDVEPIMCAYKLVTCKFKWFGLQGRVQKYIQNSESRIFTNFHRQVVCWMENWYGLTMKDIREIEEKTKEELEKARGQGSIKGTTGDYKDK